MMIAHLFAKRTGNWSRHIGRTVSSDHMINNALLSRDRQTRNQRLLTDLRFVPGPLSALRRVGLGRLDTARSNNDVD